MSSRADSHGNAGRYRADFYLFRHFLMGMGSFRDDKVTSHEAMKLVFGVNRPFRIRLDQKWHEARAVLIGASVPHFLNGEGDWQIVIWIDADSTLGILMDARTLEGRPWAIHDVPASLSMGEVIQTVGDDSDPHGALQMAETLLRVYGGTIPVPANWDGKVKSIIRRIEENPGSVTLRSLSEDSGRSPEALEGDFRRIIGSSLENYLHRRKWAVYIRYRREGMERDEALRRAGLPGWEGLRDRFKARYGLDLDVLESDKPFVRVYQGPDDQAVLYL